MKAGENMLTLVRATQRLHGEIASLLRTFEKLAGERGYSNRKDKSVSNGCSYSIDTPDDWMMPWMFRHLQKKDNPDDILIFNVILAPSDDAAGRRDFREPVVLCTRFSYTKGKAKEHAGDWDPWAIWFFGPEKELNKLHFRKDLSLDSKDFLKDADWEAESPKAMQEVRFIAMPLAAMTDSKTLEKEILKRVL